MAGKDYYRLLGVTKTATDKEVKQAYRRLARKYHPDVNPGDKTAEAKFKEMNEAYEVLSDIEKRKKYDAYGDQWQFADQFAKARQTGKRTGGQQTRGFEGFAPGGSTTFQGGDLGDLFEGLFKNFGAGARAAPRRHAHTEDNEHPIEVTLEEAYRGAARTIQIQMEEPCPTCHGGGITGNKVCATCRGTGMVGRMKRLEVRIPAGVKDGSRIRIASEGRESAPGGPKGDLYLLVKLQPNEQFERKGDDLYTEVPVPLETAILGGEIGLTTLKGKLALKIPPETQNGKLIRLPGQGMPRLGSTGRGDLFAKIKVVLPTGLKDEEKKLFERLRTIRAH